MGDEAPDSHVVVFDVNVYLNAALLLGPDLDETARVDACRTHARDVIGADERVDSLLALAGSQGGRLAGKEPLSAWSSDHILDLLYLKATQPTSGSRPEDRGLGWTPDQAGNMIEVLHHALIDVSGGSHLGEVPVAFGSPPLSHEDGVVLETLRCARNAQADNPIGYVVTCDKDFQAKAPNSGGLYALSPDAWVSLFRRRRFQHAGISA